MNIGSAVPTSVTIAPHPLSGYQPNRMESSSPKTPWQFHSNAMKQEPMDQGNDSGIHFASPECDRSNNIPYSPPSTNQIHQSNFSTPITNQPSSNMYQPHIYNDVSPLTPPNSDSMASSPGLQNTETFEAVNNQQAFIGPNFLSNNPDAQRLNSANNTDNPLRNLQMALENNELLPSSVISPKPSETSEEDENKSEFGDEYVDDSLKDSKVTKGRKKLRCKQCDFVGRTKMDMWEHSGAHIRVEKALPCTYCPFVTEYKHHLEYHLLNHAGAKPFKCSKCSYSCVNKSMLNSHMKSHSNIYQYRCSECSYATKYCHSLKLHLRKYQHKPAMVLNPDGTPNPLPIIDVYGTRRGPKAKLQQPPKPVEANPPQQQMPVPVPYPMFNPMQMGIPFPAFLFPALSGMLSNPVVLNRLQQLVNAQVNNIIAPEQNPVESSVSPQHEPEEPEALDLSKPSEKVQKNRRKGRAVKLTSIQNYEEDTVAEFNNMEIVDMTCHYCNIKFGDQGMYRKHMIFHGYNNPFSCNLCGEECSDKYSFSDHIAQVSHK